MCHGGPERLSRHAGIQTDAAKFKKGADQVQGSDRIRIYMVDRHFPSYALEWNTNAELIGHLFTTHTLTDTSPPMHKSGILTLG